MSDIVFSYRPIRCLRSCVYNMRRISKTTYRCICHFYSATSLQFYPITRFVASRSDETSSEILLLAHCYAAAGLQLNPLPEESMPRCISCVSWQRIRYSQSVSDDVITATRVELINRHTCLIEHHYIASPLYSASAAVRSILDDADGRRRRLPGRPIISVGNVEQPTLFRQENSRCR